MTYKPCTKLIALAVQFLLLAGALVSAVNAKSALGGYQPDVAVAMAHSVGKSLNVLDIFLDFEPAALGCCIGPKGGPKLTIRDHYKHHNDMRDDVIRQLEAQGYKVSRGEVSFGSSCGTGRCRPDIIYESPDGTKKIIEIKTGDADLSIRQTEIFPQIKNGDAIPRGDVAKRFGLRPGIPLKDQGYPNGIPIEIREFPGVGQ